MNRRRELHEMLCAAHGNRKNVYFQPPQNQLINYPAIVYERSDIRNDYADDDVYIQSYFYIVTVIDKNPDSEIVDRVSKLPSIRFNRHFTSENLNHDVFVIYY